MTKDEAIEEAKRTASMRRLMVVIRDGDEYAVMDKTEAERRNLTSSIVYVTDGN